MQRIDRTSPQKLYLQLAALIEERIALQEIAVGDKLPTEDQLCQEHQVSKAVVRQAMEHLARAGLIRKIAGKGTFALRATARRGAPMRLDLDDLALEGEPPLTARVLVKTLTPPPSALQALFTAAPPRQVFKLVRLFVHQERPALYETAYFSEEACPGLSLIDFRRRSLVDALERQLGVIIGRAAMAIEAGQLTAQEAEPLQHAVGHPAVVIERTFYGGDDRPLGIARATFPAGELRPVFELIRQQG